MARIDGAVEPPIFEREAELETVAGRLAGEPAGGDYGDVPAVLVDRRFGQAGGVCRDLDGAQGETAQAAGGGAFGGQQRPTPGDHDFIDNLARGQIADRFGDVRHRRERVADGAARGHKTAAAGAARRKKQESKTAARGAFSSSLDDAATASPAPFPHAAGLLPFHRFIPLPCTLSKQAALTRGNRVGLRVIGVGFPVRIVFFGLVAPAEPTPARPAGEQLDERPRTARLDQVVLARPAFLLCSRFCEIMTFSWLLPGRSVLAFLPRTPNRIISVTLRK